MNPAAKEIATAHRLLAVNSQLAGEIVMQAAPVIRDLTPRDQQRHWPSTRKHMIGRATGGYKSYRVPIEGGHHDMEGYRNIRVTDVTARTDTNPGATPFTVRRNSQIRVGYDVMHNLTGFPMPLFSAAIAMTDQGDVRRHERSVFPSEARADDLYTLKQSGLEAQKLSEAVVDMMKEAAGVQVEAAADLSRQARAWRSEFPDFETGPHAISLTYPKRIVVYSS
jgi:hypothetical protein